MNFYMDLKNLPMLKDTKTKIKKTFNLSHEAHEIYVRAKNEKNIDVSAVVSKAIEDTLLSIKPILDVKN